MIPVLRNFNAISLLSAILLVLSGCGGNHYNEYMERGSDTKVARDLDAAELQSLINGSEKDLSSALKARPELVNVRIGKILPEPPLFIALKNMDVTKVEILLEAGANPEAWSREEEVIRRPLRWAVEKFAGLRSGFIDENSAVREKEMLGCIALLLEYGANPNSRDDPHDGYTPLLVAVDGGARTSQVVQLLIEHGADKKIRTRGVVGKTAYELARTELAEMENELSAQAGRLTELGANNDTFTDPESVTAMKNQFKFEKDSLKKTVKYIELINLEFSISKKRQSISEQRRIVELLES